MTQIAKFQVKQLHGYRNLDIRLEDNTLILVGENGSGKTTILQLLYYLLSGQWGSMTGYEFESIDIDIDGTSHAVRHAEIKKHFRQADRRFLRRLPPHVRQRFLLLLDRVEDGLPMAELEYMCDRYDIPISDFFNEVNSSKSGRPIRKAIANIRSAFDAQLLYLPTYRRIEQELSLIFSGPHERELVERRREFTSSRRREGEPFVELVEFGMSDVEAAIEATRAELDQFARENLNNLTFGYLGDIVERQYESINLEHIREAESGMIDDILDRVQEPILSSTNKQHLKKIIEGAEDASQRDVHSKMIGHYFAKLMAFHKDLETRESKITNFCDACNAYMVDKVFQYDKSNFRFAIVRQDTDGADHREIKLRSLSSGEKQIVSLFCHLYLLGKANYFVLIDEPELSLSVTWQRKFLLDIREGEYCSGLVATTHSPFIYENRLQKYAHGLGEFTQ